MKKPIQICLERAAVHGAASKEYRLTKLSGAVVIQSMVGSFGADHRVGDILDEKQVQSFVDNRHGIYEVQITVPK